MTTCHDSGRLLRLVVSGLSGVLAAGACGSGDSPGDGQQGATDSSTPFALVTEGTLTACTDIPYEPFEFVKDEKVVGIDVDLVTAVAKELDLKAEFRDTDFDRIFPALAAKKCDIVASAVSATDDAERTQGNAYSDSYFAVHQSLLIRRADEAKYKDLPDLRGGAIGVQAETTGEAFAARSAAEGGYQVKPFTSTDDMYAALRAGEIEGVVQDSVINLFQANNQPEYLVAKIFGDEAEEYAFVIPDRSPGLKPAIDRALAQLRDEGLYDRILEKYLGPV